MEQTDFDINKSYRIIIDNMFFNNMYISLHFNIFKGGLVFLLINYNLILSQGEYIPKQPSNYVMVASINDEVLSNDFIMLMSCAGSNFFDNISGWKEMNVRKFLLSLCYTFKVDILEI